MFGDDKNLKDKSGDPIKDTNSMPVSYDEEATSSTVQIGSYSKTDKLITALYMITDILDTDEPIRAKLRSLGAELLSDIYTVSFVYRTGNELNVSVISEIENKIILLISFLDISSSVGIISQMNANIIKKEFFQLKQALKEYTIHKTSWLEEFLSDTSSPELLDQHKNIENAYKGQIAPIDVRKKAPVSRTQERINGTKIKDSFDDLKRQRREEILKVTKANPAGSTIKDIRSKAKGVMTSCGEKTLQRELISMVADGVLKKEGEKRWSRYSAL